MTNANTPSNLDDAESRLIEEVTKMIFSEEIFWRISPVDSERLLEAAKESTGFDLVKDTIYKAQGRPTRYALIQLSQELKNIISQRRNNKTLKEALECIGILYGKQGCNQVSSLNEDTRTTDRINLEIGILAGSLMKHLYNLSIPFLLLGSLAFASFLIFCLALLMTNTHLEIPLTEFGILSLKSLLPIIASLSVPLIAFEIINLFCLKIDPIESARLLTLSKESIDFDLVKNVVCEAQGKPTKYALLRLRWKLNNRYLDRKNNAALGRMKIGLNNQ